MNLSVIEKYLHQTWDHLTAMKLLGSSVLVFLFIYLMSVLTRISGTYEAEDALAEGTRRVPRHMPLDANITNPTEVIMSFKNETLQLIKAKRSLFEQDMVGFIEELKKFKENGLPIVGKIDMKDVDRDIFKKIAKHQNDYSNLQMKILSGKVIIQALRELELEIERINENGNQVKIEKASSEEPLG